jgi:hypothetical protein
LTGRAQHADGIPRRVDINGTAASQPARGATSDQAGPVVRRRRNAVSAPPTMQLRANMTSAKVSVEPVNGKFVPGEEVVSVVVVVGARVASACTVVGVDVLAVEPKSPIGVVGTVGIDVDVLVLVEVLEVDVLELVDDVLVLVELVEVDVLELVDDVLVLVEVLEVDVLELVDDVLVLVEVLEVDVLELLEEVGSSPPAQNETWLMVGGCPPPFSGGCSPLPLVAAGSKR